MISGTPGCHFGEEFFAVAVVFDDKIKILVSAAGEVDENGPGGACPCDLDRVGQGMGALDCGDDSLMPGEQEKGLDRLVIIDGSIFDTVHLVQKGVLGTGSRIVESAGIGIDGSGIALLVGQHDALEAVHDALGSVGDGGRVVAEFGTASQGLYADQLDGIRQKRSEHADGVGAASHAGRNLIRKMAGLGLELLPGLLADAVLEVAHHQREGMGAGCSAYTVDRVFIFFGISHKCSVDSFFESPETETDRNNIRAEQLHPGDIGCLLDDIDFTHVDVALQSEVGSGSRERDTVLTRAGLGDQLFLAHIFGQQTFAHAVVELVGAGVVEILALEINLRPAQQIGEILAVVDGSGTTLEVPADTAQLCDELSGLRDGVVGFRIFVEGLDQLRILQIIAAVSKSLYLFILVVVTSC